MPVGRGIIDALECVLSVFFSNVRHRSRAAFLLCDELVEISCKEKMRLAHPGAQRIGFFALLQHVTVGLDPTVQGSLGESLFRNHMQHSVAAATVDDQHCADAIMDAIQAIEHCFPGTVATLPDGIKIALRVVRLLSSQGNAGQRDQFENYMRGYKWNTPFQSARGTEVPVPVGARAHWGHVLMSNSTIVGGILDQIGVPQY